MPNVALLIDNLPLNTPHAVEAHGTKIVVVRTLDRIYAFEDVCPHAFWPLSAGTFCNGVLECPGHGWEFRAEDGRCIGSPRYSLTPISVTIRGEVAHLEWTSAVAIPQDSLNG